MKIQWINVKERLPELGKKVIIAKINEYTGEKYIALGYLFDSGETWRSYGNSWEGKWLTGLYWTSPLSDSKLDSVSHWMELPYIP